MNLKKLLGIFLTLALMLQVSSPVLADETTGPELDTTVSAQITESTVSVYNTPVENGCRTIGGKMPLLGSDRKLQASGAAFLYEINTDTVVYSWNPDEQMTPASLVKIMTALIAVENANLSDVVTVTEEALSVISKPFHSLDLLPGESFVLEDLIYAMMVGSANDASVVIAHHVGGSERAFVEMMNERADEIGCESTNFTNSSGLDSTDQYSTARDMAKIILTAMKNELFVKFFSATVFTLPETTLNGPREMMSSNYLMLPGMLNYFDERVTGGRTGITERRTRCLAVTAEDKNQEFSYIGVILEAVPTVSDPETFKISRYGNYEDMKDLLNLGFNDISSVQIFRYGQTVRQYPVTNGPNHVAAGPSQSDTVVLPDDVTMADLTFRYVRNTEALPAPIYDGDEITKVELWLGNVCLSQVPLIAMNTVEAMETQEGDLPIIGNPEGLSKALTVILLIIGFVACVVLVPYILRYIRRASKKAKHRRRRESRRRSR